jgi:hypothetical protein
VSHLRDPSAGDAFILGKIGLSAVLS